MATTEPPAPATSVAPPERVEVDDLVLRRWAVADLTAQHRAIIDSFEHLRAWMPWAAEPPTLERQRAHLTEMAASWPSADGSFTYGVFDSGGAVLGAIGLHDRIGPGALEIGYWCHVRHTGRGVITRSARALTEIALALPGIDRVEIRCDAANARSAAVPRRLGYRLDRVDSRDPEAPAESGRFMVWVRDDPNATP